MKKLINTVADVVAESLAGLAAAHPEVLRVSFDPTYVVRADAPVSGKTGIVSGGGSGHEPMHGGYVGKGMLDAACPGQVFTSPTPDQIENATTAVDGGAGVLHIVKNYTGDIMNFEMAAELCQSRGVEVRSVVIDDDVAVENSLYTAGRRGVGTTVLAEKICGAGAERGYDLARLEALCRRVNENGRSMGMALTSCTVPAAGRPTFELGETEMELGIGIHGEPGRLRMPLQSGREIAERLTDTIVGDVPFRAGDTVIAMVNGLGGTPLMELYLMYGEVARILEGKGIRIGRRLVGNYMTSLDMAGCSITLLRTDEEMLALWDDPVVTPGLRWGL
jgi:dihydroxyacetone kinase-like protein